jgi:hypothetical protein
MTRTALLLSLLIALLAAAPAEAQYREWRDTTLPPMRSLDGIRGNEFPTIIYQYDYDERRPIGDVWRYSSELGIGTIILGITPERFDSLSNDPARPDDPKSIVGRIAPLWTMADQAATGREIQFYPFDSSQTWKWGYFINRFTHYLADSTRLNSFAGNRDVDDTGPLRESVYLPHDSGRTIASGIAYDWKPEETSRVAQVKESGRWRDVPSGSVIGASAMSSQIGGVQTCYIALKGHLFPGGNAPETRPLLRVDLWYEVRNGESYVDSTGRRRTADANERFLYARRFVTKGDLDRASRSDSFERYREVVFPVNLAATPGGMGGPAHPQATARNFDLVVTCLGGEALALRFVAIRDSIGQLMTGNRSEDSTYRSSVIHHLDILLRDRRGKIRPQIHYVHGPDELPDPTYYAGFRQLNRLLTRSYPRADSIRVYAAWEIPWVQDLGGVRAFAPELYLNSSFDTITTHIDPWTGVNHPYSRFEAPYPQPPAHLQHNGGRVQIPLLFDLDSVADIPFGTLRDRIERYTETVQQLWFGRYAPGMTDNWPYNNRMVQGHGSIATMARDRGLPYMPVIGFHRDVSIYHRDPATDTVMTPQQEPAVLRATVNLALAYGAHGLFYYPATGTKAVDSVTGNDATQHPTYRFQDCCPGLYGRNVTEDTVDIVDTLRYLARREWRGVREVEIPGVYVASSVRRKELAFLNRQWLNGDGKHSGVGVAIRRLRWRDGYSIQWQARRPGKDRKPWSGEPRPLPADEIVTGVQSRWPLDTIWDDPSATYVELGLFETTTGKSKGVHDRRLDTNHIFILNRRTFEPPADAASRAHIGTAAKARLDSLAETRIIRVQLNLHRPDTAQPDMLHVREVAPDTTSLPHMHGLSRAPLDTMVSGGSAVELMLGPGRGALLEITYLQPEKPAPSKKPSVRRRKSSRKKRHRRRVRRSRRKRSS